MGQKDNPKDWNGGRHRVKNEPGTYAEQLNQVLDGYSDAAQTMAHEADRQNRRLDKASMQKLLASHWQTTWCLPGGGGATGKARAA